MKFGKTVWVPIASALLGALLTVNAQAQEPGSAPDAWVTVPKPVHHKEVCPGPAAPGTARCHAHRVVDAAGRTLATTGPSGYAPFDLQHAYNMLGVPAFRSTPVIAIVDAYDYPNAASDLAAYRAQLGLPTLPQCPNASPCFAKVNQVGGTAYPAPDTSGWSQEAALDLDMASAMCPNCTLILVEANSASYGDLGTAANTAATTLRANVISNSYGGGESGTSGYAGYYQHSGSP
jgi:subtilase family serine protease